jgi:tRNA A37 threonylcarbamoyladenosine dehydratase
MQTKFDRCKILFQEDFEKLQNAHILLLGVGGVGSFCLDALHRSGIGKITIVDFDTFDITNQNRQIGSEGVGEIKVHRLSTLYERVTPLHVKVTPEWIEAFDFTPYDLVLDAIDDIPSKVSLAIKTYTKLISSMGSAKKLDPTKIQVCSIWKTYNDALAKRCRSELKKRRFNKKYDVVFSDELAHCQGLGSFVGVTGSFGLTLASAAVSRIINS